MPVYYERCTKIDELLELNVDAIVAPRTLKDQKLPAVTEYIYDKAGREQIKKLYAENMGNDYWWMEHFPEIPEEEYAEQIELLSENDPIITVTEGCGLSQKFIFHICIGISTDDALITETSNPELFRALSDMDWDDDDVIVEKEFDSRDDEECFILRRCYEILLNCAQKRGIKSIAIPMLGAEDVGDFSYPSAYYAARTAPGEWLEKNVTYRQESKTADTIGGHSGKYRIGEEMEIWIIDPPYDYRWSYDPVPNVTDEESQDKRQRQIRIFEMNLRERINSSGMSPEKFAREFIWNCFGDTNMTQFKTLILYDATKFRNGQTGRPHRHRVLAITVGLELSDFDRFAFMRCAGFDDYPSTELDLDVEKVIAAGASGFYSVEAALTEMGYESNPLTAAVRGSKKNKKNESQKSKKK